MKEQKDLHNHRFHKYVMRMVIVLATILLVIVPFTSPLNDRLPIGETIVAEALGVGLIGGATTKSAYDNGILTIEVEGGAALSVDIAKDYYAQVQLPSSLGYLLEHPDIREHIKLKYSVPAPLLGFIPIKGEVKGDNLVFDTTNNIAQGSVHIPVNLSLAGVYKFTFEIDLAALEVNIPLDRYEFNMTVGDQQLDLDLLKFPQSKTSLLFEHIGFDEGEEEEPLVGSNKTNATVLFLPSTAPPVVVDPTDPSQPYDPDPTDPTDPQDPPTESSGLLTLDYVSSINFGEQAIEGGNHIYESIVLRPFIQVTDRRRENIGWTVTARLSAFENENHEEALLGSVLRLNNGRPISAGNSVAPDAYQNIELHPGGDSDWVVEAEAGIGFGTWVNRWYPSVEGATSNDQVQLEVPAGAATLGKHQASITWTLTSAPGQ